MTKTWVKKKNKEKKERLKVIYSNIEEVLKNTGLLDNVDIEYFKERIKESARNGFDTAIYMFPYKIVEKYKKIYNKIHDEINAKAALTAFRFKINEVLEKFDFTELRELEHEYYERYLDSTPVEFDGDIIITDPCYIMSDDDRDWENSEYGEDLSVLGIKTFITRDTLYGDWSCTTFDTKTRKPIGRFCADAGRVSVIALNEVLDYNPHFNYHIEKPWTTTLIKDFKGSVKFVIKEVNWELHEDTSYGKKGDKFTDYNVEVHGVGVNKLTGKIIRFIGKQTGF